MTPYEKLKAAAPGLESRVETWEWQSQEAVRGATRLMAGGAFLLGLGFGTGLALGFVFWGLSA